MGTRCIKKRFILIIVFVSYQMANAAAWLEDYTNARSLGMGGAKIGLTSDETSLYRNPANLGSIRGVFGTAFDPELSGSTHILNLINSSNAAKATEVETIAGIMAANPSTNYHARMQLTPNFTVRNFGIGLIYRSEINAATSGTNTTTMDTQYQSDMGGIIGLNQSIMGGVVKLGASVKAFNRIEVINTALPTSGSLTLKDIASEGSAVQYDAGLMVQFPVKWIPTISVVGHNLGDTQFNRKNGVRLSTTSQPTTVKESYDVAFSLFPIHENNIRSVWTIEFRDIGTTRAESEYSRRLHLGVELNLYDIVFLRLGSNQNYLTYGLELSSEKISWQFASYGEEVGTSSIKQEDRRYALKMAVRF